MEMNKQIQISDLKTSKKTVYDPEVFGVQFPKKCGCGRSHDKKAWDTLLLRGTQVDDYERLELRDCPCSSTLAVVVAVYKIYESRGDQEMRPITFPGHVVYLAVVEGVVYYECRTLIGDETVTHGRMKRANYPSIFECREAIRIACENAVKKQKDENK